MLFILSLFMSKNKIAHSGRYTDAVDELVIKFAHAPINKFKIKMTEV